MRNLMVFLKDEHKGIYDYQCVFAMGEKWDWVSQSYLREEVSVFVESSAIVVIDKRFLPENMKG